MTSYRITPKSFRLVPEEERTPEQIAVDKFCQKIVDMAQEELPSPAHAITAFITATAYCLCQRDSSLQLDEDIDTVGEMIRATVNHYYPKNNTNEVN